MKFIFLALVFCVLGANVSNVFGNPSGKTTRYWDCCKASCSWTKKALVSAPVQTCAKDGVTPVVADTTSVCGGGGLPGHSYMCNNNQPYAINSSLSFGFAAATIAGHNESQS